MFKKLPFATVDEVAARVQEQITEDVDLDLANSMLNIVSANIRAEGVDWDPILAPDVVRAIAITAAARGYMNAAGYELERGDMMTVQRSDVSAAGEELTPSEIARIKKAAGTSNSLSSIPLQREVILYGGDTAEAGYA